MVNAKGVSSMALVWLTFILAFCGWIIMLAGVSALQHDCGSALANQLLAGVGSLPSQAVSCGKFYRWD